MGASETQPESETVGGGKSLGRCCTTGVEEGARGGKHSQLQSNVDVEGRPKYLLDH